MKSEPGRVVEMLALPKCDFCWRGASYDFATTVGPWAYGCDLHWLVHRRYVELGVGKAQRLILKGSQEPPVPHLGELDAYEPGDPKRISLERDLERGS